MLEAVLNGAQLELLDRTFDNLPHKNLFLLFEHLLKYHFPCLLLYHIPNQLDRLQLGCVGRQEAQLDVVGLAEVTDNLSLVDAGVVKD